MTGENENIDPNQGGGGQVGTPAGVQSPAGSDGQAEGSTQAPANWRETLPEELRDHASLKPFADVGSLAKSFTELSTKLGADKIVMPKEGAPESEWNAFYKALGRPDESAGYDLKAPEGTETIAELSDWFRNEAYKQGLSTKQAQGLYEAYITGFEKVIDAKLQAGFQAGETALKIEWGNNYDENKAAAMNLVKNFMGEDFVQYLVDSTHGNDARMVKGFYELSKLFKGDNMGDGQPGSVQTPEELEKLADDIMDNKDNPEYKHYWSQIPTPEKEAAVQKVNEYRKRAGDLRRQRK